MSTYSAPRAAAPRRKSKAGVYGLLALVAFMALIVWRSFQVGGVRCEVCITYEGRSQCRAVDGTSRQEALLAATQNVCAFLSSGVTDSMACARTPPTKEECTARE
jgi:hypothetical protein